MNIGIPNESLKNENRVALTPVAVASLVQAGHSVLIESAAGNLSRFDDESYRTVGGTIVYSKEEIIRRSDMVCGVEPPTMEEIEMMDPGKITLNFLNLPVARPQFFDALLGGKISSAGYELIETEDGDRPVLHSMSEIAGQMSIIIAARYLEADGKGRGITIGGISGVAPAAVVVLGAGVVGTEAARTAAGLGAQVIVLDTDLKRLRNIESLLSKRVTTALATPMIIQKSVAYADVLVGAVFIKGGRTPHVVTEEMVKSMKPGAVIVDVSIDQGGCVETSRPTTLRDPAFVLHDVIHYCVPNITATVARTATYALTNTLLPYVNEIASLGIEKALRHDGSLAKGICSLGGQCTNQLAGRIFGKEVSAIERLLVG